MSYAQLDGAANRVAHALRARGVGAGDRVALALARTSALVVAELAVAKAGAVYVPLDRVLPDERQQAMVRDSDAKLILTEGDELAGPLREWARLDVASPEVLTASAERVPSKVTAGEAAYVMYTSGSTGRPNGVVVPHRAVSRLVINNGYAQFGEDDRVAFAANPAFDASTLEVWAPLLNGGCVVVIRQETLLEPQRLVQALQRDAVNVLWMTVGLFNQYQPQLAPVMAQLRYLIIGGDALDVRVVSRVLAGPAPQHLLNGYGPTETTTFALTHEIRSVEGTSIPLGRPIGNTQVYVLDERRQPVPVGVTGELYIGGDGVALGYLNQPQLTEQRFLADPFSERQEARMYRTGDLGRWREDGTIESLGRNDFQVKIRGFRIELGEIEAKLVAMAGVSEAIVVVREAVQGGKQLVAYCTGEADVSSLHEHAQASLPAYMVPAAYVKLEAWPLTPNGKLDRKALPAPDADALVSRAYEAPQGDLEETLATIWADLLKVERVGRQDNFFELGGHSLLAVSLVERMRREGLHADVRTLFTASTLADLASKVAQETQAFVPVQVPDNLIPASAQRLTPEMVTLVELSQESLDEIASRVEGGAANVQDIYPLAPLQEGILFHHMMEQQGDAYLLPSVLAFKSGQRLQSFLQAVQKVVDRHDILRTGIEWEGLEQPVQVVRRQAILPVHAFVVSDGQDAQAALEAHIDPAKYRLDVRKAPLLEVWTVRAETEDRWLLGLLVHHLALDHTTLELMVEEALAIEAGRENELAPPVPFRDFVAQSRLGVSREEHEAFFKDMLGDVEEPTAPYGVLDVQGDGSNVEEVRELLAPELAQQLRHRARQVGVSPASVLHQAWAVVLARLTGQQDVVFGTVLFGRLQGGAQADRGMGMFINTLPLKLSVGADDVAASLQATHRALTGLVGHEHASLALAQRMSQVPASRALFTSLLNYRHSAVEPGLGDARAQDDGIEQLTVHERTNYPLTVSVDDFGEQFMLTVQARLPIDARRVCTYLAEAVKGLLSSTPSCASVDILPPAERAQVLHGFNATEVAYRHDQCLHELIEEHAHRTPQAIALRCEDRSVSYAELNAQANRLARHLRTLGVSAEQRVAVCAQRGVELVVGLLAVLKAGGAYVPLDPAYPRERLAFMLADSSARVVLCDDVGAQALSGVETAQAVRLDDDAIWRAVDASPLSRAETSLQPGNLAYVIYTSGSTGQPKGVAIEHRSVCNLVSWHRTAFALEAGDGTASTAGVGFDACAWEIWSALCNGACLHLAPASTQGDALALLAWWSKQPLKASFLITPLAEMAYQRGLVNAGVRTVLVGGDRLRRLPQNVPAGQRIVNNYGPTETTVVATSGTLHEGDETVHIGRPVANTRVYILDERRQPVAVGVTGELYIGGAGVARGYLNQPELTQERFLADPFSDRPSARMYRTGDVGRWREDGTIEYLGRNDFQVKIRGFRIELGEIEAKLATASGVQETTVLARDDARGDKQLVAYYTGDTDAEALRDHAQANLPAYMVPAAYVKLAAWPLTPNGKLDRKALPAPDADALVSRDYEAPRGQVEETLAAIWADLLKVEHVGRQDDFFELGGHSLLAVQLASRVHQALGVELALKDLFAHAQLRTLASHVSQSTHVERDAIPVARRDERLPLSLAQQRLWFLARMDEQASQAYHISAAVRLDGELDERALRQALAAIVARHESLRTRFVVGEDGQPYQVIDPAYEPQVPVDRMATPALQAYGEQEAAKAFDLSRGPLLRVRLARLDDRAHVLFMTMHHIVSDGWSMGVLVGRVQPGLCGGAARPGGVSAAAASPVRGLRAVATRPTARRSSAGADRVLAHHARRRPDAAGAAGRPCPPRAAKLPRAHAARASRT